MKQLSLSFVFILIFFCSFSQITGVGIGTSTPHSSAILELKDSARGFLPPRMSTAQRNSIQNPTVGLQIYNLTTHCLEIYDFGKWNSVYCITPDSTQIVDIDGNYYPTVKICDQTWTTKNLDVSRYKNGDTIPHVTDATQWANLTTGAWCWYNNDSANGAIYGKLYNWYAVNDSRGLAPEGWHVPSDAEWNILVKCTDPNVDTTILGWQSSDAGGKLKSTSYWNAPNTGAINSLQFNALPGGRCFTSGSFSNLNNNGYWWSSSEFSSQFSWMRYLSYSTADIHRFQFNKIAGFSIRCVKN